MSEWTGVPEGARAWRWDHDERRDGEPWGPGPWDGEPDKVSWTDPGTGRPCLIVRGPLGALCGYVAVDPGHPLHGVGYDDAPSELHDVAHGGLTFADGCAHGDDESRGICHVPEPGQPDGVWWFGFDCGHMLDVVPALECTHNLIAFESILPMASYKPVEYVVRRCRELAAVLVEFDG